MSMGLFDNIFLDQNSHTTMLDPLIQNQQNIVKSEEKKSIEDVARTSLDDMNPPEMSIDRVSFDEITSTKDIEPVQSKGFLSGGSNKLNTYDDISFDIGGIDLPAFEDATLSEAETVGDKGTTVITMIDTPNTAPELSLDASIALVQGATSATSDAIMDNNNPVFPDDSLQPEVSMDVATQKDSSLMEDTGVSSTESSVANNGIMGLFSTNIDTPPELEDLSTENIPTSSEKSLPNQQVGNVLQDNPTTESMPLSISHYSVDSPLHEMLMEFITKLEKFNSESIALDTKLITVEADLNKEQEDLNYEFHIRMSAIEYKRKHLENTRIERKVEKSRLERIIANLKQESI